MRKSSSQCWCTIAEKTMEGDRLVNNYCLKSVTLFWVLKA